MTQKRNAHLLDRLSWVAFLIGVAALAMVGIFSTRLDYYWREFLERGLALPPVTILLFDVPRFVYVLFIVCLAVGFFSNQFYNYSPSGRFALNLVLAIVSSIAAFVMSWGLMFPLMVVKRLSVEG